MFSISTLQSNGSQSVKLGGGRGGQRPQCKGLMDSSCQQQWVEVVKLNIAQLLVCCGWMRPGDRGLALMSQYRDVVLRRPGFGRSLFLASLSPADSEGRSGPVAQGCLCVSMSVPAFCPSRLKIWSVLYQPCSTWAEGLFLNSSSKLSH